MFKSLHRLQGWRGRGGRKAFLSSVAMVHGLLFRSGLPQVGILYLLHIELLFNPLNMLLTCEEGVASI
jgi:hypothetical protein